MQMLMCSAEGCHAGGSPDTTHLMERLETTPASAPQICAQTAQDPTLSKVRGYVMYGWPHTCKNRIVSNNLK